MRPSCDYRRGEIMMLQQEANPAIPRCKNDCTLKMCRRRGNMDAFSSFFFLAQEAQTGCSLLPPPPSRVFSFLIITHVNSAHSSHFPLLGQWASRATIKEYGWQKYFQGPVQSVSQPSARFNEQLRGLVALPRLRVCVRAQMQMCLSECMRGPRSLIM